jgi:hypothetical protein
MTVLSMPDKILTAMANKKKVVGEDGETYNRSFYDEFAVAFKKHYSVEDQLYRLLGDPTSEFYRQIHNTAKHTAKTFKDTTLTAFNRIALAIFLGIIVSGLYGASLSQAVSTFLTKARLAASPSKKSKKK